MKTCQGVQHDHHIHQSRHRDEEGAHFVGMCRADGAHPFFLFLLLDRKDKNHENATDSFAFLHVEPFIMTCSGDQNPLKQIVRQLQHIKKHDGGGPKKLHVQT